MRGDQIGANQIPSFARWLQKLFPLRRPEPAAVGPMTGREMSGIEVR